MYLLLLSLSRESCTAFEHRFNPFVQSYDGGMKYKGVGVAENVARGRLGMGGSENEKSGFRHWKFRISLKACNCYPIPRRDYG